MCNLVISNMTFKKRMNRSPHSEWVLIPEAVDLLAFPVYEGDDEWVKWSLDIFDVTSCHPLMFSTRLPLNSAVCVCVCGPSWSSRTSISCFIVLNVGWKTVLWSIGLGWFGETFFLRRMKIQWCQWRKRSFVSRLGFVLVKRACNEVYCRKCVFIVDKIPVKCYQPLTNQILSLVPPPPPSFFLPFYLVLNFSPSWNLAFFSLPNQSNIDLGLRSFIYYVAEVSDEAYNKGILQSWFFTCIRTFSDLTCYWQLT